MLFGVLLMFAAQTGASSAGGPEIREQRIPVTGPWRDLAPGRRVAEFQVPPSHGRHLRIDAPGARGVWLNGARLEGPGPDYDSGDRIAFTGSGRGNRLEVESDAPVEAAVRILPRVHISGIALDCRAGAAAGVVTVRNTLENTTNVVIRYETGDQAAETVATVPAEAWQDIPVSGPCKPGGTGRVILTKDAEAMEGGYRFVVETPGRD